MIITENGVFHKSVKKSQGFPDGPAASQVTLAAASVARPTSGGGSLSGVHENRASILWVLFNMYIYIYNYI